MVALALVPGAAVLLLGGWMVVRRRRRPKTVRVDDRYL
jgi:hypothetical protein